jgi:tRNA (guanine37-N1)-methyltransferase
MLRKLYMPRQITIDASPPIHRGMRDILDREVFRKSIPVLAACVPAVKMGLVLKSQALRGFELVI